MSDQKAPKYCKCDKPCVTEEQHLGRVSHAIKSMDLKDKYDELDEMECLVAACKRAVSDDIAMHFAAGVTGRNDLTLEESYAVLRDSLGGT